MKQLTILCIAIMLSTVSYSQRHEIGLFLGTSYYNGDLNPSVPFLLPNPAGGIAYRYMINPRWNFKFNAYWGQLEGDDQYNPDKGLRDRNLYFKTNILEFAGIMEFNFMRFVPGSDNERFAPYIFGGLSVFRFNPRAHFNEQWFDLQPLGTEGQGTTAYPDRSPYSLVSVGIPFGIGVKYSIGANTTISFEWGMRKTFTDYIDDVSRTYADPFVLWQENTQASMIFGNRMFDEAIADMGLQVSAQPGQGNREDLETLAGLMYQYTGEQRGDASTKDWYSFAGITLTFQIRGPRAKECDAYRQHHHYREYRLRSGRRR